VAGCGDETGKPSGSDEQQVRAALFDLAAADGARDYGRYCELISDSSARAAIQLAGGQGDCPSAIAVANGSGHRAADGRTIAAAVITVSGDSATAISPGGTGSSHLVREDGRWRVEIFGPRTASAAAPAPAAPPAVPPASEAASKSAAREAVSNIEACYTAKQTYEGCDAGVAQVEVRAATADSYEVVARSPAGNQYRIVRGPGGVMQRTCTAAQATSSCSGGTW
jgi:hypothetical protein